MQAAPRINSKRALVYRPPRAAFAPYRVPEFIQIFVATSTATVALLTITSSNWIEYRPCRREADPTFEKQLSFDLSPRYSLDNLSFPVGTLSEEDGKPVIDNSGKVPGKFPPTPPKTIPRLSEYFLQAYFLSSIRRPEVIFSQ